MDWSLDKEAKEKIILEHWQSKTDREIATILQGQFPKESVTAKAVECYRQKHMKLIKQKGGYAKAHKLVRTAINLQKIYKEQSYIKTEIAYKIENPSRWTGVVFSGDWHIEGSNCDIKKLEKDIQDIGKIPNLYFCFMGDGCDNFVGNLATSQFDTVFPPRIARHLFFLFLYSIQTKLIALLSGDHEWFSLHIDDFDMMSDYAKRLKIAYLGPGGMIELQVGKIKYFIQVRHRYRYNSSYNPLHTCRQFLRFEDSLPDAVFIAHNHINAIGLEEFLGKIRLFGRTGTYKIGDRYAQRKSYLPKKSVTNLPVALFCAEKKEMRIASSIEEAKEYLEFLNKEGGA